MGEGARKVTPRERRRPTTTDVAVALSVLSRLGRLRYRDAMPIVDGAGGFAAQPGEASYVEQLRTADLSVGTYSIAVGGFDRQSPHTEDEVYVVTSGHATFVDDSGRREVGPSDVLFVGAGVAHHFEDVTADLALVVVFGPAEGARA
jgi:mannose-6-phosphate isomerase-like protein (cupin superfamily)